MGEKTKPIILLIVGILIAALGVILFQFPDMITKFLPEMVAKYFEIGSRYAWILTVIGVAVIVKYAMDLHKIIKAGKEEMIFYGGESEEYKKKVVKAMQYKVEERRSDNVSICAHCGVRLEDFPKKCPNCGKKQ